MSALSLRLPESLHQVAKQYAQSEGVSINQFISTALAEKLSSLATEDYIEARAARGSRTAFEAALAKVPATQAPIFDQQ